MNNLPNQSYTRSSNNDSLIEYWLRKKESDIKEPKIRKSVSKCTNLADGLDYFYSNDHNDNDNPTPIFCLTQNMHAYTGFGDNPTRIEHLQYY